MSRIAVFAFVVLLAGTLPPSAAEEPDKGGYQPWHNIFAKRYKNLTPEEERLQKFWHDYYDSLRRYYAQFDRMDWVEYYKRGHNINGTSPAGPECKDCKRIPYAPVFVSPSMQWAVPGGLLPDISEKLQKKPK